MMFDNFFDIYSRQDNKLLKIISFDHLNKLKAYSNFQDVENLYEEVNSVYSEFLNINVNWIAANYSLKFEEKKLVGYLEEIAIYKLHDWNHKILKLFPAKSREYKTIFPDGINQFSISDRKDKIKFIQILIRRLKTYYKAYLIIKDINKYYRQLTKIFKIIEVKTKEVQAIFILLEKSRAELSVYLFKNFNLLIEKNSNNPELIHSFFDFSIIPDEFKFSIPNILINSRKEHNPQDYNIKLN